MYYDRKLEKLSYLIEKGGPLRWLFDYVKDNEELDFLVGKNRQKEWISVYRGLSRILTILPCREAGKIRFDAADAYKFLSAMEHIDIFGKKEVSNLTVGKLKNLLEIVKNNQKFNRYYQNKKEGYYQTILSRRYGIFGNPNDDFVLIDKETVIGYESEKEKVIEYSPFQALYKKLLNVISAKDSERFGSNLSKKAIGNEVDFLALDKDGNLLIIEYKHGTNTSGIYLSPIQIGLYYDLFNDFYVKKSELLNDSIFSMLEQKQKIGLINPLWPRPREIKSLIPVLIISEFNRKSVAKDNFLAVMEIARKELGNQMFLRDLKIYDYTLETGLVPLNWLIEYPCNS
ncbi:MAG: hypothetical protein ABIA97_00690 [Candidatus Omnitrophota bacterium]